MLSDGYEQILSDRYTCPEPRGPKVSQVTVRLSHPTFQQVMSPDRGVCSLRKHTFFYFFTFCEVCMYMYCTVQIQYIVQSTGRKPLTSYPDVAIPNVAAWTSITIRTSLRLTIRTSQSKRRSLNVVTCSDVAIQTSQPDCRYLFKGRNPNVAAGPSLTIQTS